MLNDLSVCSMYDSGQVTQNNLYIRDILFILYFFHYPFQMKVFIQSIHFFLKCFIFREIQIYQPRHPISEC